MNESTGRFTSLISIFTAGLPSHWVTLRYEHATDYDGTCRGCRADHGSVVPSPCPVRRLADDAWAAYLRSKGRADGTMEA